MKSENLLLEFCDVSKSYNSEKRALHNVSFSVKEGEFISVIGPSGAGKSTLLRCINRLIDASSGQIYLDGIDVLNQKGKNLRAIRTNTGMIFQHYNLVDRLSVVENVLHGLLGKKNTLSGMLGLYTEEEKEEAFEILEELGLSEYAYKRCDELSGGQKQRVGIARALMQQPKLLLCDEPIASLDPKSSKVIMNHLKNINKVKKITCIVNLHQVEVAKEYSSRIIGINGGRIVFDGSPEELTEEKIQEVYKSNVIEMKTGLEGAEYDPEAIFS